MVLDKDKVQNLTKYLEIKHGTHRIYIVGLGKRNAEYNN